MFRIEIIEPCVVNLPGGARGVERGEIVEVGEDDASALIYNGRGRFAKRAAAPQPATSGTPKLDKTRAQMGKKGLF